MGCSYTVSGRGATMSSRISISSGSEGDLQSAVANIGPISIAVDARSSAFRVKTQLILKLLLLIAVYIII